MYLCTIVYTYACSLCPYLGRIGIQKRCQESNAAICDESSAKIGRLPPGFTVQKRWQRPTEHQLTMYVCMYVWIWDCKMWDSTEKKGKPAT